MSFRICAECGAGFESTHHKKIYCCHPCQVSASRRDAWVKKKIHYKDRCRVLLAGAKNRSKAQDRPFDITLQYLTDLWEQQGGICAISGIPFNLDFPERPGEPRFDAPSLDRIIPDLGYVEGNVRLVIYQVNMAIGPYGLERLLETIKTITQRGLA